MTQQLRQARAPKSLNYRYIELSHIHCLMTRFDMNILYIVMLRQLRSRAIESEIEDASPQLGSLRLAVAALQRKILDVGGPKLSRAQAKVDILTKQFETLNATLSTKEVEESNLRKQVQSTTAPERFC